MSSGVVEHVAQMTWVSRVANRRSENKCAAGARLVLRVLIVVCVFSQPVMPVGAQGETSWEEPVLLSEGIRNEAGEPAKVAFPLVVSDDWGGVHAFWTAAIDEGTNVHGRTLFYASLEGGVWTQPNPVLYADSARTIWQPQVAIGGQGWVHVAWTDGGIGDVWYSRAPVSQAHSARAWSSPLVAAPRPASGVSVLADEDGNVHLVYAKGSEGVVDVYHTASSDGVSWSDATYLGSMATGESLGSVTHTRQAVGAGGRLHVVWGQTWGQQVPVYYARSDDGGASWTAPLEVDRKDARFAEPYGPGHINVATIGDSEVHLVWFGAPSGHHRWHRWSWDGGNAWSAPGQIFAKLTFNTEPPAIAADSAGALHMVTRGSNVGQGFCAYYAWWREGGWSDPFCIDTRDDSLETADRGEFAALAVAGGNTLHAVWNDNAGTEIWASSRVVDAPPVAPQPRPTRQASPTPEPAVAEAVPTPARAAAASDVLSSEGPAPTGNAVGGMSAVMLGVVPVVALLMLVLVVKSRRGMG